MRSFHVYTTEKWAIIVSPGREKLKVCFSDPDYIFVHFFLGVLVLVGMDNLKSQDIGPPAYIISTRSICSYEDNLGYYKKSNRIGQDCNWNVPFMCLNLVTTKNLIFQLKVCFSDPDYMLLLRTKLCLHGRKPPLHRFNLYNVVLPPRKKSVIISPWCWMVFPSFFCFKF